MCGEHQRGCKTMQHSCGSSPRVWGTPSSTKLIKIPPRFIPTCVGNTTLGIDINDKATVHPHVCGEHIIDTQKSAIDIGSSPRVWGTQGWHVLLQVFLRFIPTCVGNTSKTDGNSFIKTVHPHVCGEHIITLSAEPLNYGSSPRVWGTRQ